MAEDTFYNFTIERCRKDEFPQLKDTVYVDHAGATLYSRSQMTSVHSDLTSNLYANPHSQNSSSKLTSDTVDQIRYRVLRFFNASPDEYSLVFTSGSTAALKVIADGFTFGQDLKTESAKPATPPGVFCYLDDSHTSVQGMRETMAPRTSDVICLSDTQLQVALASSLKISRSSSESANNQSLTAESPNMETSLPPKDKESSTNQNISSSVDPVSLGSSVPRSLVAFPAQSNFSGRKYPLDWVAKIQNHGLALPDRIPPLKEEWYVLLDAAAFISTSKLDLSTVNPDFVTVSFYKIFGYPTGLGALLISKRAGPALHKTYFGGGTVAMSTADQRFHVFKSALHDKFEDGTLPYLSIVSLRHGFDTLQRLAGGIDKVSRHVHSVAHYFHSHLHKLCHGNGRKMATIYGAEGISDPRGHGGVVTFNLQRADGTYIGYAEVDKFAQLHDVHLRTGCFCNIGACQRYLGLTSKVILDNFDAGHVCGDNMDMIDGKPTGAVRVSFGYMSTLSDARICLRFIADTFLEKPGVTITFEFPKWYERSRSSCADNAAGLPKRVVLNGKDADLKHGAGLITPSGDGLLLNEKSVVLSEIQPLSATESMCGSSDSINDSNSTLQLSDEVSSKCSESVIRVTDIMLYPLKSCGAFRVREWEMGTRGLLYDREWILVNESGVTIGQKREPRICLLRPELNLITRKMVLNFPRVPSFELPLDQETDFESVASFCTNKVCGDRVNTFDCGDEVSDWLSNVFNTPGIRLLRQQSDDTRQVKLKDKNTNNSTGEDKPKLSMANESQLLVLSKASVRELTNKMAEVATELESGSAESQFPTVPTDISENNLLLRFRGNLVVDGGRAFEEDSWTSVNVGTDVMMCHGPCSRCQMICTDQMTAEKSREPLRTLSVWRGKKVPFGVYSRLLPRPDGGRQVIKVGDEVKVINV